MDNKRQKRKRIILTTLYILLTIAIVVVLDMLCADYGWYRF